MDRKISWFRGDFPQSSAWNNMTAFGTKKSDPIQKSIIPHEDTKKKITISEHDDGYSWRDI